MKQKILVLGMIICCLFGLTACGEETVYNSIEGTKYDPYTFTDEYIKSYPNDYEEVFETLYLQGITPENFEEKLYFRIAVKRDNYGYVTAVDESNYDVFNSGYENWYKALDDIGFNSVDTLNEDISVTDSQYYINKEGQLVIEGTIQGTKHSALMEMYVNNDGSVEDMGITVDRSKSEKLGNAGLNTLLGMGMAFTILIIISLIISLFPRLFGGKKKKESDKEITQKAMDNTISQIAEQEDLSSDAELVAVIAAAIAAYEGSGSTDGFRVRSIRKVNSNWKKY